MQSANIIYTDQGEPSPKRMFIPVDPKLCPNCEASDCRACTERDIYDLAVEAAKQVPKHLRVFYAVMPVRGAELWRSPQPGV